MRSFRSTIRLVESYQCVLVLGLEDHEQRVLRTRALARLRQQGRLLAPVAVHRVVRRAAVEGHVVGCRAARRGQIRRGQGRRVLACPVVAVALQRDQLYAV